MKDRYIGVSLPEGLTRQAQKFVGNRGYESVTEIVKEALRFRLEQLARHQRKLKAK
jgi:Arc/MetJ-type ribon-helix-helix transcriptional regulator